MTFLELCQKARQEARITGAGPAKVVNQNGILAEVVSAVNDAWLDIQALHNTWTFMERVINTELVGGDALYKEGDLGIADLDWIKQFVVSGNLLKEVEWDWLVRSGQHSQANSSGTAQSFCVTPNGIRILPTPDSTVPAVIQYFRKPKLLKEDTERPTIASYHCNTIVWKAVMDLASNESDSVIYQKASEKFNGHLSKMEADYLPEMNFGGRF